jgi:hypothetical protein
MGFGQIAVLRVWPLRQHGIIRVDLEDLDYLADLTAPSQPPPLVTAMRCGDECDVTAVVPGHELTAEGTAVRDGILRDRGQCQQRAFLSRVQAMPVTSPQCPNDVPTTRAQNGSRARRMAALSADIQT